MSEVQRCPCGQPVGFSQCCGPIVDGQRHALSAEELMRSRYSAFSLGDSHPGAAAYLLHSWDSDTRPNSIEFEAGRSWQGLVVHESSKGGAFDNTGTVRFTATYLEGGQTHTQSELSSFRKLEGRWVYVGVVPG